MLKTKRSANRLNKQVQSQQLQGSVKAPLKAPVKAPLKAPKRFGSTLYGKSVNSVVELLTDRSVTTDMVPNPMVVENGTGWLYKTRSSPFPYVITSASLVSTEDALGEIPGNKFRELTGLTSTPETSTWQSVSIDVPLYVLADHNDETFKLMIAMCRSNVGSGAKDFDLCLVKNISLKRKSDESVVTTFVVTSPDSGVFNTYFAPLYLPNYNSNQNYIFSNFGVTTVTAVQDELLAHDHTISDPNPGVLGGHEITVGVNGQPISGDDTIYRAGVPQGPNGYFTWSMLEIQATDTTENSDYTLTFDILVNSSVDNDFVYVMTNNNILWTNKIWATLQDINDNRPKTFLMEVIGGDMKSDVAVLGFVCVSGKTKTTQITNTDVMGKALLAAPTLKTKDNDTISVGDQVMVIGHTPVDRFTQFYCSVRDNKFGDSYQMCDSVVIDYPHLHPETRGAPILDTQGNVVGQLFFGLEELGAIGGTGAFTIARVADDVITRYITSLGVNKKLLYVRAHLNIEYKPMIVNSSVLDYEGFVISSATDTAVQSVYGLIVKSAPITLGQKVDFLQTGDIIQSVTYTDSTDTKNKPITVLVGHTPLFNNIGRILYRTIPDKTLTLSVLRKVEDTWTKLSIPVVTVEPTKVQNNPYYYFPQMVGFTNKLKK